MEAETAKKLRVIKHLYGASFDEDGDILLVTNGNDIRLSGGAVYLADVCQFIDERWIPDFLARKLEIETGVVSIINGLGILSIKEKTQPLGATYTVYANNFKEEHSAVILGVVQNKWATNAKALFADVHDFFELVKNGSINRAQETLILRIFASRDCPNNYHRKVAGEELQKKYK
ncbi:MAG: hypothetical protein PHD31_01250 [Candidatus Pacebacteria bacterium]|nr:hypothetical protein [Candidatus Paceibacterota bacterium]